MVDSTAESEEDSAEGTARFIRKFRPLGTQFASAFAGCFNVQQELMECAACSKGTTAAIKITFSPSNEKNLEPTGGFLWLVEPMERRLEQGALWTELINTPETISRQISGLRIGRGKKLILRLGHNRLIRKAAQRIAEVLNAADSPDVQFADYAAEHRLSFKPRMCE